MCSRYVPSSTSHALLRCKFNAEWSLFVCIVAAEQIYNSQRTVNVQDPAIKQQLTDEARRRVMGPYRKVIWWNVASQACTRVHRLSVKPRCQQTGGSALLVNTALVSHELDDFHEVVIVGTALDTALDTANARAFDAHPNCGISILCAVNGALRSSTTATRMCSSARSTRASTSSTLQRS